jgi:hypothetical protein
MDEALYSVDLATLETRVLIDGLSDDNMASSSSNRYVAWSDGSDTSTIHVTDLSTMESVDIDEKGKYLKPLGFMEDDLVYGVARRADIVTDAAGNTVIPMYQIRIDDITGDTPTEEKRYEKEGYYVSGVEISGSTMYLNRIRFNGTSYVEADQDMIMNREGEEEGPVTISEVYSDDRQTEVVISSANIAPLKKTKFLTPKDIVLEEIPIVTLEKNDSSQCYYVYAKGHVTLCTPDAAAAVTAANENMGVVIDDSQNYIWKRSRKTSVSALRDVQSAYEGGTVGSVVGCISAMLAKEDINVDVSAMIESGETPKNVLKNTMREMQVIDLTGCDVEETLYYVNLGNPVFAMTGSDSAVLITGYDSTGIIVYDPTTGITHREAMTAAQEIFAAAGNIFFAYLR